MADGASRSGSSQAHDGLTSVARRPRSRRAGPPGPRTRSTRGEPARDRCRGRRRRRTRQCQPRARTRRAPRREPASAPERHGTAAASRRRSTSTTGRRSQPAAIEASARRSVEHDEAGRRGRSRRRRADEVPARPRLEPPSPGRRDARGRPGSRNEAKPTTSRGDAAAARSDPVRGPRSHDEATLVDMLEPSRRGTTRPTLAARGIAPTPSPATTASSRRLPSVADAAAVAGVAGVASCSRRPPPDGGCAGRCGRAPSAEVAASAEGGNRTHTPRGEPDFESGASASSATSARPSLLSQRSAAAQS